jgi:uncharacterized protein with PIN domain
MLSVAAAEGRVVLTRDRKVLGKPGSALCYYVLSSNARDGFQEVVDHFGLEFTPKAFMARCSNCNASCYKRLEQEQVDKLTAEGALPVLTGISVTKFYMCMGCRKVFWKGPKYESARAQIAKSMGLDMDQVHDELDEDGHAAGHVDGLALGALSSQSLVDCQ